MHDEEALYGFSGFMARTRGLMREHVRFWASIGFMLLAVGAIHFQEHMSPTIDRITNAAATGASKTLRVANGAMMSAALPFFIRS